LAGRSIAGSPIERDVCRSRQLAKVPDRQMNENMNSELDNGGIGRHLAAQHV
jgi:hypothetical protein